MIIQELKLQNFRNLSPATLSFSPQFNYIAGANGSGKSSLLEALALFGLGRSFRSSGWRQLLQHGQAFYRLQAFCLLNGLKCEGLIYRQQHMDQQQLYVNGEQVKSKSEFVCHFPVQVIHPESGDLIAGGPVERRRYLDWGAFHVERELFVRAWQQYSQALQQRNSLVRRKVKSNELSSYSDLLCKYADEINFKRENYFLKLRRCFSEVQQFFFDGCCVDLQYYPGWDQKKGLAESLMAMCDGDMHRGYTYAGAHRADVKFSLAGSDATKVLSRGQQKLLVYALRLAQGVVLQKTTGRQPLYLFDDLAAELDQENLQRVLTFLGRLGSQVFVSGIDENSALLKQFESFDLKQFHVERGYIKEVV